MSQGIMSQPNAEKWDLKRSCEKDRKGIEEGRTVRFSRDIFVFSNIDYESWMTEKYRLTNIHMLKYMYN
jgi:hypothetical protein